MKKIVIDACVFSKQFIKEDDSKLAIDFFDHIVKQKFQILAPHLYSYEILSTAMRNKINYIEVQKILDKYEKRFITLYKTNSEILKTVDKILSTGHKKSGFPSFYDSIYHAIAMVEDCDFITTDKKHYEKTKNLGNIRLLQDFKF
jgi:predicted nucleic acid-binding protein